jgi:hypothetical protein
VCVAFVGLGTGVELQEVDVGGEEEEEEWEEE